MRFCLGLLVGGLWGGMMVVFLFPQTWRQLPVPFFLQETGIDTSLSFLRLPYENGQLKEFGDEDLEVRSPELAPVQNWKILQRVELDRQRRCSAAPPWPVRPSSPRGFALLFATVRNLNTHIIWERWLTDAYNWIHEQGLESPDVPPHQSDILRSYLHYSPAFDRKAVDELMTPMLKGAPIKDPIACVWANTAPCSNRIFEFAYHDWPEGAYFTLLSHNTVPMKPFSVMYKEFLNDQKARTSMVHFCFDDRYFVPKSATWRSLPRNMVRASIERPHWTEQGWLSHGPRTGVCDEGQNWTPIMSEFGEGFAELIHAGPFKGTGDTWKTEEGARFHFDCWGDNERCKGLGRDTTDLPRSYHTIKKEGFLKLLADPQIWFFRKVSDSTLVDDTPLSDWIFDYWDSPSRNVTVHLHPNVTDHIVMDKKANSLEDLRVRWEEDHVFGLV